MHPYPVGHVAAGVGQSRNMKSLSDQHERRPCTSKARQEAWQIYWPHAAAHLRCVAPGSMRVLRPKSCAGRLGPCLKQLVHLPLVSELVNLEETSTSRCAIPRPQPMPCKPHRDLSDHPNGAGRIIFKKHVLRLRGRVRQEAQTASESGWVGKRSHAWQ